MNPRWRPAAALAFLLALTIGFYWQLTWSRSYTWLENPDQANQVLPWLDFEARELHVGRLPLWDPYQVGGQSLIGQVQPGLANPLNWILFAMPVRDGHIPLGVLHWYWVLIHWVAAAFCFWLCRDLGASLQASVLGAAIFTFAGFVGHAGTPQFLMSAIWFPLVFLFFARVYRGERPLASAALCGAAMGMALLSGHHNIPIYGAVLLGGLWLAYLVSARQFRPLLIFCVISGLVSAVQMLPAVEYGRKALRWSGAPQPQHWKDAVPYFVHAEYSLHARAIPGMVIPGLMMHANPFVGIVALSLALTAIARGWKSQRVRLFAAVALGGLLLALGADSPVHRLAYLAIPMVEKARYPAMAIALTQVGIAALAALGLDVWRKAGRSKPLPLSLVAFALAIFGIYGALTLLHHAPNSPAWIIGLVALAAAGVLWWGRATPVVLLALFVVEATTVPLPIQRRDGPNSLLQQIRAQSDIAEFLKGQPGWFRVMIDEDAVPDNFGDYYGIEQFGGYLASMPAATNLVLGDPRTPAWFGVQYFVGRKPSKPGQVEVFQSRGGLKVYRNPGMGEPLWAVHDSACATPDRFHVTSRVADSMILEADLACAGRVVAGDPWYQGWRAWVDGKRVRIQEFEGVLRAIPVEAGRHTIEFRYRPGAVYWGAALTLLGLLLTAAIWRFDRNDHSVYAHNKGDDPVAAG